MISESEAKARKMLARIGKRLRVYSQRNVAFTNEQMRVGAGDMANEIREYLKQPPKKDQRTP